MSQKLINVKVKSVNVILLEKYSVIERSLESVNDLSKWSHLYNYCSAWGS